MIIKKTILSFVTCILLIVSINTNVFAETVYTEGALNYIIQDGEIIIVNYFGSDSDVVVPEKIGSYYVTTIAKGALTSDVIKSIKLPETVTKVEEGAIKNFSPQNTENEVEEGGTKDISSQNTEKEVEITYYDSYGSPIDENILNPEDAIIDEPVIIDEEKNNVFEEQEADAMDIDEQTQEELEETKEIYSSKVSEVNDNKKSYLPYVLVLFVIGETIYCIYKMKNKK